MRLYNPLLNGTIPVDHPRMVTYITQYKLECWNKIVAKLENIGLVTPDSDPHDVFSIVEVLVEGNIDLIGNNVSIDGDDDDEDDDPDDEVGDSESWRL